MNKGEMIINKDNILKILRIHYSIDIDDLEFLREGGSIAYIVKSKSEKYLLKIIGCAFSDTIMQSVDITLYLEKHSFPVPKIIHTTKGIPYCRITQDGNDCLYILYEFIEGTEPNIDEKAKGIGELVGQLHKLMQNYSGYLTARDRSFFISRYINILKSKGCSEAVINQYETLGYQVWDSVKDLPQGFCHGDLHRGNLLLTSDDKLYILDFDTSCRAPRMFDIMVMCDTTNYFALNDIDIEHTTAIFSRFAEGYTKYMPLSMDEINSFYDFIAVRHYQLQATIVEIFGLDCIDKQFIDDQLKWLNEWRMQYVKFQP